MRVVFTRMNEEEFARFMDQSMQEYALDLIKSRGLQPKDALAEAKREFSETLPDGIRTQNQHLMNILDAQTGTRVGTLWYLYEEYQAVRQVFLNDINIDKRYRRKGFASAALLRMEEKARQDGREESVVYVWKHNPAGLRLYEKNGYIAFREENDGIFLKKKMEKRR